MKEVYSKAVIDLVKSGRKTDQVLENLKLVLKSHGHEALLPTILSSTLRTLSASSEMQVPVVLVANADAKAALKTEINEALNTLGADDEPDFVIDDTLVGGFIALWDNKAIDASYKTQLLTIYQNALT